MRITDAIPRSRIHKLQKIILMSILCGFWHHCGASLVGRKSTISVLAVLLSLIPVRETIQPIQLIFEENKPLKNKLFYTILVSKKSKMLGFWEF